MLGHLKIDLYNYIKLDAMTQHTGVLLNIQQPLPATLIHKKGDFTVRKP
ncbi:hypothetical protein RU85_GL000566 [Lactococcus garvieae]|nr:hypothetical protein RU85_GL000566 [Lactococcus garvieae]